MSGVAAKTAIVPAKIVGVPVSMCPSEISGVPAKIAVVPDKRVGIPVR
jgi:hypothetical protein